MKSTLLNMTAVLSGITLVASAGVGAVNMITARPIAEAEQAAKVAAIEQVLPAFEETASETLTIDDMPITVYTATQAGQTVGYAVETMSKQGFGGAVALMVGFTPEGEVVNVNVLKQTETPGLGTKMADVDNPLLNSVKGKRLEEKTLVDGKLAVRKDGGDVDALTAATISSRAYVDAINRAWMAYKSVSTGTEAADVASGASAAAGSAATEQDGDGSASAEQVAHGERTNNGGDALKGGENE